MTFDQVLKLGRDAMIVAIQVSMPALVASMVVGFLVSIFQATTQIHDQTLAFVPKIMAVIGVILVLGGWMMRTLIEFTRRLVESIPGLI